MAIQMSLQTMKRNCIGNVAQAVQDIWSKLHLVSIYTTSPSNASNKKQVLSKVIFYKIDMTCGAAKRCKLERGISSFTQALVQKEKFWIYIEKETWRWEFYHKKFRILVIVKVAQKRERGKKNEWMSDTLKGKIAVTERK